MTLSFTQTINGKPNYFIHKIWRCILKRKLNDADFVSFCYQPWFKKFGETVPMMDGVDVPEKLHTIREYRTTKTGERAKKQWKSGDKIHPAINNRSKNYFQFAPTIECNSVQEICINRKSGMPNITIDGKEFYYWDCEIENGYPLLHQLAINDGFDSVDDFLNYFSDGTRQLIHWTDLKY